MAVRKVVAFSWVLLALAGAVTAACSDEGSSSGSSGSGLKCPDLPPGSPATCREAATAKDGAQAAANRQCAKCHGADLSGATAPLPDQGAGNELYPPNLTPDATGIKDWSDDQLAAAIRTGQDRSGLELCRQMRHDATMTDFEAFSLVLYLRSLPPVSKKVPRSVCPPLKTKEDQNLPR